MYIVGEVHYELLRVTSMCAVVLQQLTGFLAHLFLCICFLDLPLHLFPFYLVVVTSEKHIKVGPSPPDCLYLCSPALLVQSLKPKLSPG